MTRKGGPSQEYRDLLSGRITPEQYVQKVKREVGGRVGLKPMRRASAS